MVNMVCSWLYFLFSLVGLNLVARLSVCRKMTIWGFVRDMRTLTRKGRCTVRRYWDGIFFFSPPKKPRYLHGPVAQSWF
ncbi:hypothetical protein HOY82DRAFT_555038 [Tuber indicum]|nr:hypothetical protein HOY82DRAFT_555038 [Tuber indicum]